MSFQQGRKLKFSEPGKEGLPGGYRDLRQRQPAKPRTMMIKRTTRMRRVFMVFKAPFSASGVT
jgi:hypothetical protein